MQLLIEPNPTLRIRCRDDFVVTMRDIMGMFGIVQDKKALGLAAPQVGIDGRFFVTYWSHIFVNPRISQVDVKVPQRPETDPRQTAALGRLGRRPSRRLGL
jgi:peptide deformylase